MRPQLRTQASRWHTRSPPDLAQIASSAPNVAEDRSRAAVGDAASQPATIRQSPRSIGRMAAARLARRSGRLGPLSRARATATLVTEMIKLRRCGSLASGCNHHLNGRWVRRRPLWWATGCVRRRTASADGRPRSAGTQAHDVRRAVSPRMCPAACQLSALRRLRGRVVCQGGVHWRPGRSQYRRHPRRAPHSDASLGAPNVIRGSSRCRPAVSEQAAACSAAANQDG